MALTTTITERSKLRPGFTLVEILVVMAIGTLMLAGVYSSVVSLSQGSNSLINYVDMNNESRYSLELLGRDIRGATNVSTMTAEKVILTTAGPNKTSLTVEYFYEPDAETFYRKEGGETQILLNNVDDLEIRYYTLLGTEATVPMEVKHIQVEAVMQKTSLRVDNTNHIISAQFMLRNKSVAN